MWRFQQEVRVFFSFAGGGTDFFGLVENRQVLEREKAFILNAPRPLL
jgi:hypothetical protein